MPGSAGQTIYCRMTKKVASSSSRPRSKSKGTSSDGWIHLRSGESGHNCRYLLRKYLDKDGIQATSGDGPKLTAFLADTSNINLQTAAELPITAKLIIFSTIERMTSPAHSTCCLNVCVPCPLQDVV